MMASNGAGTKGMDSSPTASSRRLLARDTGLTVNDAVLNLPASTDPSFVDASGYKFKEKDFKSGKIKVKKAAAKLLNGLAEPSTYIALISLTLHLKMRPRSNIYC